MNTRSQFVRGGLMAALIIGLMLPAVGAFAKTTPVKKAKVVKTVHKAKPAKVADITVVGTVATLKNKKGRLTGVTLTDGDGNVHQVMMSAPAKKLAKTMDGKSVEVVARPITRKSKKGATTFLKIKQFKASAAAPAPVKPDEGGDEGGGDE